MLSPSAALVASYTPRMTDRPTPLSIVLPFVGQNVDQAYEMLQALRNHGYDFDALEAQRDQALAHAYALSTANTRLEGEHRTALTQVRLLSERVADTEMARNAHAASTRLLEAMLAGRPGDQAVTAEIVAAARELDPLPPEPDGD